MLFFLIILLLIISNELSFSGVGEFNKDYLDKKNTTAVNGVFVILIVFSHYAQYANFGGLYDDPYLALRAHLGQMVVASFLFYSGYGMMESIKKSGETYVKKILTKFWQLLLRCDMAVLLFLVLDVVLGISYLPQQVLLAFTTWTSVGNSNWYITAILMIYIAMYVSFRISGKLSEKIRDDIGILLTFLMTILFVFIQMKLDRPTYCYNTMILAPAGLLYSKHKDFFERIIMRNDLTYYLTIAITIGVYVVAFFHKNDYGIEGYTVWALSFTALLVLFTMKVKLHNSILEWLGTHVFSIYILQRMPMIILSNFGYIETHKYISLIVSFAVTIPLAIIFEIITGHIITGVSCKARQQC